MFPLQKFIRLIIPGLLPVLMAAPVRGGENFLPDSLLTDDYVYEYTFSDFARAERILNQMRERKMLPQYRLDKTAGDLYFNTGHYHQALRYYFRALASDSVRLDDAQYMDQLHRMISCYDCLHNEAKKAQYVELLLEKAEQCGDEAMQSVALFNMGKSIYYQGNKETGYEYMERAVELMEGTDYKYKYDNLRYNYNTLLVFEEQDLRHEEALRTLDDLERVVMEQTGLETPMEGLADKERKALYAHRAVILSRLGHTKEAEGYYKRFRTLGPIHDRDNYLIMPYLFDQGMYDEIIRMNRSREKLLSEDGDTVNYHMTTIKKTLGQAYAAKGDYRTAARYFEELSVLRDSIKNREQHSATLELAALYETNEKELALQQRTAELHVRNVWLFGICGITLLALALLVRIVHSNRMIRRKNTAMVATIGRLVGYREEVQRLRHRLGILGDDTPCARQQQPEESETQRMFERLDTLVTERCLYLDPDLSRDKVMKQAGIPRKQFAQVIQQHAGTNFAGYLNNLRLEHAVLLLQKYPDYTLATIAAECGIPNPQTFYRLFRQRFGMTPSEYRAGLHSADSEKS